MTATREHRNASLIDDKINAARIALEEAGELLEELAAFLPDEYPYPTVVEAHDAATEAVKKLWEEAA